MRKQAYLKPAMQAVEIQQTSFICASDVKDVQGDANLHNGGGGGGEVVARSRGYNGWDDEDWDEEE